eukprot:TRINITY_DN97234_c0_g1_i1.p1 TRINITY_DN97234_c0_g1~~TRINITY_DN97234_c0_g1_i1.p1  ORF type:complete len:467 (-),score=48.58 TRINITY_DN97234_c0_g1_i1:56-1456(-)
MAFPRERKSASDERRHFGLIISWCLMMYVHAQYKVQPSSFSTIARESRAPSTASKIKLVGRPGPLAQQDAAALLTAAIKDARTDIVEQLLILLREDDGDYFGQEDASMDTIESRGRLHELISRLEAFAHIDDPVYHETLNGQWTVKYSGSFSKGLLDSPTRAIALMLYNGGFSLGGWLRTCAAGFWGQALGIHVDALEVDIRQNQEVTAIATVNIAGVTEILSYAAEIHSVSPCQMVERIKSIDFPEPLGKQSLLLDAERRILVTYLDKEIMIVRDESGVPDVLVRRAGDWGHSFGVTEDQISGNPHGGREVELPNSLLRNGKPDFSGRWKVVNHQGDIDRWMADLGFGWMKRKAAKAISYGKGRSTWDIKQNGNRTVELRATGISPAESFDFTIDGSSQRIKTLDGFEIWTPTWDGYTLQTEARSTARVLSTRNRRYYIDDQTLVMESTSVKSNIRVSWIYKRQP